MKILAWTVIAVIVGGAHVAAYLDIYFDVSDGAAPLASPFSWAVVSLDAVALLAWAIWTVAS